MCGTDDMDSRLIVGRTGGTLSVAQPRAVLLKEGLVGAGSVGTARGGRLGVLGTAFTSSGFTGTLGALPKPPNGVATLEEVK